VLSTRLTRPAFQEAVEATRIEPGVRYTFGPIVFTGKVLVQEGLKYPEVGIVDPVSQVPHRDIFEAAWKAFPIPANSEPGLASSYP